MSIGINPFELAHLPGGAKAHQGTFPTRQCNSIPPLGRAMLIGRSCLILECLREAMSLRGIETALCRIEQRISAAPKYDVFVMFLARCEPGSLALVKQRMSELSPSVQQTPAVALVEDADVEAAAFCGLGFSTVVMGLPSIPFAVDLVQGVLGPRHASILDHAEEVSLVGPDHDRTNPALDVSFTPREMDLLDLLRRGMQNKLIAYRLGISQSTVKAHLRSIMMKLKAKNRTQAVSMLSQDERIRDDIDG